MNQLKWHKSYKVSFYFSDNAKIAEILIAKGADLKSTNIIGDTALSHAALWGNLLFALRIQSNSIQCVFSFFSDYANLANVLLDKGAEINAKGKEGNTPLHRSVYLDNQNVVKILTARGADLNAQNNEGETALHRCGLNGSKHLST